MNFESLLNTLLELFTTFGLRLVYALLVLIVGLKVIKWIKRRLPRLRVLDRLDDSVQSFLTSTLAVALYILLGVTVAMLLGVPSASFIAALASCLAAVGLAMQGSLSNFAGGLMLLIFKPFSVGNYISAPEQGVEGTVKAITVIYTVLQTYDGIEVTIPNGTLMNSVVKNLSITDARRVDLPFRVDPTIPVAEVEAILAQVVAAETRVLPEPTPFARLTDIAGDALTYTVRIWCPNAEYWNVRFDLTRAVKDALDAHGVTFPRSQLDVHMEPLPGKERDA